MAENLIINGVDHAKFDLEWAKRGGIVKTDDNRFIQFTQAGYVGGDWGWFIDLSTKEMKTAILYSELDYDSELDEFHIDRMATPQECEDAGVEYIEPPMVWRPIETAPESTYTWPWCQDDKPDKLSEHDWEYYEIKASRIIAYDNDGFVTEAYNWFGKWYCIVFSGEFHEPMEINPVKWMPLPRPYEDE